MASERSETSDRSFPISSSLIEAVAWAAGLVGLTLAAASIVIGGWDHDGGFFLLRGDYVAQGLRPFVDYVTKYPPLVDVITALAVRTGASRIFLAVSLPFAWIFANALASAFLTWTVTRSRAIATLIAALYPLFTVENEGNHLTLEHGVAFFALLALAAVASEESPLTLRRLVLCGICVSAAILSKQNGAVALLPVAAIVYARRAEVSRKMIGAFVAGLALLPVVMLVWLGFDVAAIYKSLFGQVLAYAAKSAALRHDGWRYEFIYAPWSAMLYVIVIVAAIAVIIHVPRWRLIATATLLAAVIEGLARVMRDYRHYNLNMWPFMVLLLALAAAQPEANRGAAVVAVLLVFAASANFWQFRHTYSNDSTLLRVFLPAAHVVEAVTPPHGVVRLYGDEPIIEFLADRREDRVDKENETAIVLPGRSVYYDAPPKDITVVTVDNGEATMPPLLSDLARWHFRAVAKFGHRPEVTVFRSLDATQP